MRFTFNYSLLVFASVLGVVWFGEALETTLVVGALLVVLGGLLFATALPMRRAMYFYAGPWLFVDGEAFCERIMWSKS
ncbi:MULTISPECIES: hypothetical protein [unclassified Pseudomonas]|jgi:hypothetical protein|uniref:hypothetical protein n=1 Tax=unclassified Pseudomonas TaxID=196821 RepID=UPI000487C525|nr:MULTISPECIES: hypothetical protein [unclassified Pseudomonas]SME96683.1 hypothetical protein SAMN05660912_00669 [Pseudomonas sp. LAMO17WK12:I1]